jgi:hypothetical protein
MRATDSSAVVSSAFRTNLMMYTNGRASTTSQTQRRCSCRPASLPASSASSG